MTVHPDDAALRDAAVQVLDDNWLGNGSRPSPALYPHRWSWDAGFVAIGYAHTDQGRAQRELESLFDAQWANGMLPHIVFADGSRPYFPGPEFWQTERSRHAPRRPRTSGILQPPVHATAAWHLHRCARDRHASRAFLERLYPRLLAWHDHLYRERVRDDSGLAEVWHPWESGMDNSPLWDGALARLRPAVDQIPAYRRLDLTQALASERPTDAEYDRYIWLVARFRERRYEPTRIRADAAFAVRDVLFNSLLVRAGRDLARIAREVGADPRPLEERADRTAAGIDTRLWSAEHGTYLDHDVITDEPIEVQAGAGFAPLFAGVPDAERARTVVAGVRAWGGTLGSGRCAVPSLHPDDPGFQPARYWRGPVWVNVNWLLAEGLRAYGEDRTADLIDATVLDLARRGGFWEHYDPTTGRGHGAARFAWTAALVLDILHRGEHGTSQAAGT